MGSEGIEEGWAVEKGQPIPVETYNPDADVEDDDGDESEGAEAGGDTASDD